MSVLTLYDSDSEEMGMIDCWFGELVQLDDYSAITF